MNFNKYVIATEDSEGNIIFYNTLTYAKHYIDSESRKLFYKIRKQILETGDCVNNQFAIKELVKANIIYKDDRQINELLNQRKKEVLDDHRTFSLILLPTEQCNFRCGYCYESHIAGKMSLSTINKICELTELIMSEYDMLSVSWFGGEPLLALQHIQALMSKLSNICKKHKKPFVSGMTTNGYLLSSNTIKELIKMHILQYQVTLDGGRETHDRQRPLIDGSGTFDVILKNLLYIKRNIKTSTIKVVVRVNISDDFDKEELAALSQYFEDDKRFHINVQRIFEAGNYKETSMGKYLDVFDSSVRTVLESLTPDDTICYAAKNNTLMIRTDGSIGKCTVNLTDKDNFFGNINELNLEEFSFNKLNYCHSVHIEEECKKCSIYPICFGRQCPARKTQLCNDLIVKYWKLVRSFLPEAQRIHFEEDMANKL